MATKTEKGQARKECRVRHGNICAITLTPEVEGNHKILEVHHKIPLHYGGSWEQDNLILLRRDIHKAVHDETIEVDWRYLAEVEQLRRIIRQAKHRRKNRGS